MTWANPDGPGAAGHPRHISSGPVSHAAASRSIRNRWSPTAHARDRAFQNRLAAENKDYSRGIRRDARRHAPALNERAEAAEAKLEKLLRAEEQKLTGALDRATQKVGDITHEVSARDRWMGDHPTAPAQLNALGTSPT